MKPLYGSNMPKSSINYDFPTDVSCIEHFENFFQAGFLD